jgi:hypothetical protein
MFVPMDSELFWTALFNAAATVCVALISLWNAALARRNAKHLHENTKAVNELEHNTNSIKDELLKVTSEASFARGLKVGTDARQGEPGPPGIEGPEGAPGPRGPRG